MRTATDLQNRAMTITDAAKTYYAKAIASPVGRLTLVASAAGVAAVLWEHERAGRVPLAIAGERPQDPVLLETQRQLGEYFAGLRKGFDLPLDFAGTPFQRAVWNGLLEIPYGQTRTYRQLAERLGKPSATRAVGAANGRNPISIIVPCHRVIGSDGTLTGFAGGLAAKAHLLELEGISETPQRTLAL